MAWVYILETNVGRYYIGSTHDLKKRLRQHELGHTYTTANFGVKKLLLSQEYKTLKEARSVERKIKRLKRKDYIEKMIKEGYIRLEP